MPFTETESQEMRRHNEWAKRFKKCSDYRCARKDMLQALQEQRKRHAVEKRKATGTSTLNATPSSVGEYFFDKSTNRVRELLRHALPDAIEQI